jgi:ACS family tartrate transporter-like MFS transporter
MSAFSLFTYFNGQNLCPGFLQGGIGIDDSGVVSLLDHQAIGRRTLHKAAWRIIPLLSVCYAVAFMDRINISFAAIPMNRDLHFNPAIYGFGAGVFFVSYAICEVPSNLLLLKFGARRWIARIMLTWGLLAAAMMFVRTPASFYILRFLLGVAEAGFFPGVFYYLSLWFPQSMRARTVSRFYVAIPLSNVLMGAVAGLLLKLNGRLGLKGWQWLFLLEAMPAIALSAVVFFALADGPAEASWLEPAERRWLLARLEEDRVAGGFGGHGSHAGLLAVLREPRIWLLGVFFMCSLGCTYAYSFSAPSIMVAVTGLSIGRAGFVLSAIGVAGAVSMVVCSDLSDRWNAHRSLVAGLSLLAGAGYFVAGTGQSPWVVVGALAVASASVYGLTCPAFSLLTAFISGPSVAVGIAVVNTCAIMGGFWGPNWMGWSITRSGDYRWGLSLLVVPCVVAATSIWLVGMLNPAKRVLGKASG